VQRIIGERNEEFCAVAKQAGLSRRRDTGREACGVDLADSPASDSLDDLDLIAVMDPALRMQALGHDLVVDFDRHSAFGVAMGLQ
jgi:hypothetical protein